MAKQTNIIGIPEELGGGSGTPHLYRSLAKGRQPKPKEPEAVVHQYHPEGLLKIEWLGLIPSIPDYRLSGVGPNNLHLFISNKFSGAAVAASGATL